MRGGRRGHGLSARAAAGAAADTPGPGAHRDPWGKTLSRRRAGRGVGVLGGRGARSCRPACAASSGDPGATWAAHPGSWQLAALGGARACCCRHQPHGGRGWRPATCGLGPEASTASLLAEGLRTPGRVLMLGRHAQKQVQGLDLTLHLGAAGPIILSLVGHSGPVPFIGCGYLWLILASHPDTRRFCVVRGHFAGASGVSMLIDRWSNDCVCIAIIT